MLKIESVGVGCFDLLFDDEYGNNPDVLLQTIVNAVIFTDAESVGEKQAYYRRGWWYRPDAGTLLWKYMQGVITPAVKRDVIHNISAALEKHGFFSVRVVEVPVSDVSFMKLSISASYKSVSVIKELVL